MGWLRSVAREVLGLFVDDGPFAVAILVWLALVWGGLPRLMPAGWEGAALFAGLAAIMLVSAVARSRR